MLRASRLRAIVLALLAPVGAAALLPAWAGRSKDVRVEAVTLLNEGVSAYSHGDYPLAVMKLRRAASLALNSFQAHYYLGLALSGDRRYAEAVEVLSIALDLDPNHLQAHVALGNARLQQGDTDEAMAEYYRALKLRSEHPAALDGIARVYESRAEEEKAIELYNRAIASNKAFAEAYTHLGDLYLRLGRLDEAVELLVEAVAIRPEFAEGLNRLAAAYERLGLHNEAVATIQKALGLEPKSAAHWTTLGEIQLEMALLSRAEGSFERALDLDRGHPQARVGMAEIARRRGLYDAALEHLAVALSDPRTDSRSRDRLEAKSAAFAAERAETARLESALAGGTAEPEDYRALAVIHANRGDWNRAADLQSLGDPRGIERERLAYLTLQAGRYRQAHLLYAELAQEEPRAELLVNDGVALAKLGDDAGAIEAYRRALALDPTEARARLYLGNALLRLGRKDEAVAAYRKYLDDVTSGEARERVRRILAQIAPETLPAKPPRSSIGAEPSS